METTRRDFLKVSAALGGGLALEFSFPLTAMAAKGLPPTEVNAWVVIHPDDRVVVRIARSEMGQGTQTALAQLVAEELDADWSKVSTEFASPNEHIRRKRIWGSMSTGGSQGVRSSQDYVRKAGAAARIMLVEAAAARWQVPAAECIGANGVVTHAATGRRLRYGELAGAAAKLTPPKDPPLRDPKDWKIAGKPLHRLDIPDKVLGKPVFGVDVALPGMLHASVAQCPVFGGKVKGLDAAAAEKMRGVKQIVREADFVAVIADSWWRADQALQKLKIEWDEGGNGAASSESIMAMLREGLADPKLPSAKSAGDVLAALAGATKVVEAEYYSPYINHTTMEPQTCTAWLKPEGFLEVWTSTQNAEASLATAAETAGLPLEKVEVHKMMLGGGFGRRGAPQDFVKIGVLVAKAMPGTPVKTMWNRAEDMQHGFYHPVTQCKLRAGVDAQGRLQALHMRISGQSILAGLFPQNMRDGMDPVVFQGLNKGGAEGALGYAIPHLLIDHAMRNPPVRPGFWRGVNLNQNAVYLECFLDEVAHATKQDPLALRRQLLAGSPKHLAVLNAVAERAGWGTPAKPVNGQPVHRGLAQIMGFGSYVAACAEVSVSKAGELTVHRIVAATDCGHAVNPQQIEAQVEGSFAYGLSAALLGECTLEKGRFVQTNFHSYPVLLMAQMPAVETIVMPSGGFWGGVGEPTIAVAAPAVLNAIFAATGKRIRQLPLKDQDLKTA